MKMGVALYRPPCYAISVLVMTWARNFGPHDKVTVGRNRFGSSSDLILSNISSPYGGCRWSKVLLGWQLCWILIPSPLPTSWIIRSGPGPMVLALGDSFLKVRLGKEVQVDDLRDEVPPF